ncbi:threonine aldolase family protein [Olivibacter sitiensis]|uniref:threonine aldolase family protein n=1 Tax=Olivibacter sitiensis TaxID=376470 RepID=UPI0004043F88|nr:beta-eliminating lyase-related protein [Olivibacter sitiensis]
MKSFASDNYAGAVPEVLEAVFEANKEHQSSYGADGYTEQLKNKLQELIGLDLSLHLVFNGTGANVFGLSCMLQPYESVLCAQCAHIYNDESTSPEAYLGTRLVPLPIDDEGKLTPEVVARAVIRKGDMHFAQPKVLSITQCTEYGTVYSLQELEALKEVAKDKGLLLHMDGSRLFMAAAALRCSLSDIIHAAGVDVLSLGGTKLGMLYGEAVLLFNRALWEKGPYMHKRSMQLSSKNRFIAVQFLALLKQELWRKYAVQALAATQKLLQVLDKFPQIVITKPVQANAIFATMPEAWIAPLQEEVKFYVWDEHINEVRLMCAFDTDEEEIARFERRLDLLSQG